MNILGVIHSVSSPRIFQHVIDRWHTSLLEPQLPWAKLFYIHLNTYCTDSIKLMYMTTVFSHICFVKPITGYSISERGLLSNNNVGRRMFVLQFCRTANKFSKSSSKTVILREMKTFIAEMLSSLKVVSSKKSTVGHRPLLETYTLTDTLLGTPF